jgi:hypothetical protein
MSCQKKDVEPIMNYDFIMDGRTYQDNNGYYYLTVDTNQSQTLHKVGAKITSTDKYGLPAHTVWSSSHYWEIKSDTLGYMYHYIWNTAIGDTIPITGYYGQYVPVILGSSHTGGGDDSTFMMMAVIPEMKGDTIEVYGEARFEEGDIHKYGTIKIIIN